MLLVASLVQAQSVEEIKRSRDYYWGEGEGTTIDEADQQALHQMSRSICTKVINITAHSASQTGYILEDLQKTISNMRFKNLPELRILKDAPNAIVFRYISKAQVQAEFKQREDYIRDLVNVGLQAEAHLQIDDALRCYYWADILAEAHPTDVEIEMGEHTGSARALLPVKLSSVISLLRAEVTSGEQVSGSDRVVARVHFTYNGHDVSKLQFSYYDGQSLQKLNALDGYAELDFPQPLLSESLSINYEVRFRDEVPPMDVALAAAFDIHQPHFDTHVEIPFKLKGSTVRPSKPSQVAAAITPAKAIKAEEYEDVRPITPKEATNPKRYEPAMMSLIKAISEHKPAAVFPFCEPEAYRMIETLLTKTGTVTISGRAEVQYVEAGSQILAKSLPIKLRFKGRTFHENLVTRFNPQTGKIQSVSFALTKVAENDIMNSAAKWPEVSRWTILNFMEDYQTAFVLKRLNYIQSIFSDDAIIITGTVLRKATKAEAPMADAIGKQISLRKPGETGYSNVRYNKQNKQQYISRLAGIFRKNEYVHLTFENNETQLLQIPGVETGAAFGIQIRQRYVSSNYSDDGYLTFMLDPSGPLPIIHVRLWQPDKGDLMNLDEFLSNFNF